MHTRIGAIAASAALLQAFAFAHAEELHKDGLSTSGVKLTYEASAAANGDLQIDLVLECREKKLETTYGAAIIAVVSKAGGAPSVQKASLTCDATGGQDRVTVVKKATAKMMIPGATPADIGTKVVIVGRSKADDSPKLDRVIAKLEEAVQKEVDKATAG